MATELHRTIDAVWRIESATIIGAVARMVRDLGLAEELAQDALLAALEHWPTTGMPDNPGAWLMTTAKHRAIDRLRQQALHLRKQQELGADADARGDHVVPDFSDALDTPADMGDDLLRLLFTACHPVLSAEARIALTLRLLGGLSTADIARAFLLPEATIAQRIVRAKRTLAEARVPFEVPRDEALATRLDSVLTVIYLIFNEGYAATAGADWMRPALCDEALRLGRLLAQLAPLQPEVHGLLALMELQASRARARTDSAGAPILLLEQDRSRWDALLISRGLAALQKAGTLAHRPGPYAMQAAIAACHARAKTATDTDWLRIVTLYEALAQATGSPVVRLNQAVAVSMARGPAAALPLVEALLAGGQLQQYHLLSAVHADLLLKLGRQDEARRAFEQAAALTQNQRERGQLLQRAADCGTQHQA